jgi:hypothetical protein
VTTIIQAQVSKMAKNSIAQTCQQKHTGRG